MNYENSPAAKLVASRCACCSRPLVDAVSVEAGVGPECRAKYGLSETQGSPDLEEAAKCLLSVNETLPSESAHKAANVLVHKIACEQTGSRVLAYTKAIRALGYSAVAARIEKRLVKVTVALGEGRLLVHLPYESSAVEALKNIKGRKFEKETKTWSFPAEMKKSVWEVMQNYYPGVVGVGPKGLFQI